MYTNKYEEIKKIFKEFNKAYFNERDVKKTLSFLDDNIFALGISETNIVYNIEEMEIMITEEIKNDPSSYEIDFKYLEVFTISENLFLLICISTLKKEHSVSNSTPINFRTSVIIKETNNEYKFSKIHASIPVETSNLFDFDREIGNIHLNAKHTAFNLLNSSIPGGMIGGYYKENFPLYFINKHLLDKLEYKSQEEFIKDINGYVINGIHPEDREYVCKIVDSSVKDKDEYEVEYRMKKSNGSYIWVLDRGRLVQTENGPVIVSICLDITEKVYLQENIKTITNNIPGGVYKLKFDEDLTIIYGNDGFYKIHGYSPEEMKVILGNKLIAVTLPEDIPKINAILKNALENNLKNFEYEKRIITKNGEIRYLLTKGVFVKEDGEFVINSIVIDISDRKVIENKLKFNQEKLKLAMHSTKNIIFEYDLDSKTLTHLKLPVENKSPRIIYNVPDSRIKSGEIFPEHIEKYHETYESIHNGKPKSCCTIKTRLKNQNYKWTKITLNNIIINNNPSRKAIGIVEDITEHQEFQLLKLFQTTLKKALIGTAMGYAYINLSQNRVSDISGTWQKYFDNDLEYTYTYFFEKMIALVQPEDKENVKQFFSRENIIENMKKGKNEYSLEFRIIKSKDEITLTLLSIKIINNPVTCCNEAIIYSKDIEIYKDSKNFYNSPSISLLKSKNKETDDILTMRREAKINNLENILVDFKRTTESSAIDDTLFQYIINILGKYYDADHVSIIKYDEVLHQYICTFEYCHSGKTSNKKHWNDLKIRKGSDWEILHENKKIVKIKDIESLKNNDIINYLNFTKLNISSYFSVAIETCHQHSLYLVLDNINDSFINMGFFELVSYVIESKIKDEILKNKFSFLDYHDMLTGLANHKSFVEYKWNKNFHNYVSLGIITSDINGLKQLNEKYGPHYGDEIIIKTANVFKKYFSNEKLFRLSGDEFLIVCENMDNEVFQRNIENIKLEFSAFENDGLSIGYSWADDEIDFDIIHKNAEELMYINKQRYYQNTNFLNKHYRPVLLQKLLAEIKNNEYHVFLQPKIDLKTKKLSGMEALIRHIDSAGNIIPPIKFIPLLEKERLIRYIDFFVFEEVCKLLQKWKYERKELVPISLNFSRNTLLESEFVKTLKIIMSKYDITSNLIEIEITETIGEIDTKIISNISKDIKNAGFLISLDDFGSKYSNISLFTTLEFDTLKLDKSLVEKLQISPEKQIIVKSVINMCKEMNVKTVGEGIETEELNSLLTTLKCDYAQGYLYSRPISIKEFEKKYF